MSAMAHAEQPARAPAVSAPPRIAVLHLIYSCSYGGIESVVLNWVRAFDRTRFDIHVAYFAGDRDREAPFLRAASLAGVQLIPIPWSPWKPFLRAARAVARIVRERGIDIIHTHAYYGDAVGALAGLFSPAQTIATVYVWGKYELHRQIMQAIDWTAIQFMDRVTAHCLDTARKTLVLGRPRRSIPVLLPGYPDPGPPPPESQRRAMRRQAGIGDHEILLLNTARIAPEKAQDQLLRSFRLVHARHPQTRLWISGVGLPWLERKLLLLRRELDLENAVQFAGFHYDFHSLLNLADIMVHPSHVEGIPLAILGGMAAGLPIVASAVGGIPEVIQEGQCGVQVPENDIQGFAEAVIGLIEDRPRARELGRAARLRIVGELSLAAAVRQVEEVYRDMLARRSPATGPAGR